jgi:hypothetical protein
MVSFLGQLVPTTAAVAASASGWAAVAAAEAIGAGVAAIESGVVIN